MKKAEKRLDEKNNCTGNLEMFADMETSSSHNRQFIFNILDSSGDSFSVFTHNASL